ncbi:MAG: hypothetical protein IKR92_02445 [Alphaproteobacteria bacterium]|nr:hypothetical protein [Alphaproteobacteria bacterium]
MRLKLANRVNKSFCVTVSAPIKGLNQRDNISDMEPEYAVTMDNYLPSDTKVCLRKGYILHAKLNAAVSTLATYSGTSGVQLLAVANHKVWNISSGPNAYEVLSSGITNDAFRTAQYKDRLFFVNGTDTPKVYTYGGSETMGNWSFSATGLDATHIVNVGVSKQRLWFVEKNSLKVWYPQTAGNVSGTLKSFDFAQICRYGGHLVAVAAWTQDGGQGIDDLTVFITSEGEVLVYSGSDIEDADSWSLRGSYKISRPIGWRCLLQYQGDLVVITEDGYLPLSKALPLDKANVAQVAFSDAIRGLVLSRTQSYASYFGWQGIIYSRGGFALFNVPVANNFEQHVINLNTGAWCRFTGIRAFCWEQFDKRLYFGSDDGVYLFDEGHSDAGAAISGVVEQAYNNLGTERLKRIQLLNPRTKSVSPYNLVIYTNMDMEEQNIDYEESIGFIGQTLWGVAQWSCTGISVGTCWGNAGKSALRSQWIANSATGYKAGIVFKTKTAGNAIEWYETAVRFETGDGVL